MGYCPSDESFCRYTFRRRFNKRFLTEIGLFDLLMKWFDSESVRTSDCRHFPLSYESSYKGTPLFVVATFITAVGSLSTSDDTVAICSFPSGN